MEIRIIKYRACSSCETHNNPEFSKCWKCGKQLNDDKDSIQSFNKNFSEWNLQVGRKYIILAWAIVLCVGLFFWILFLLKKMR